MPKRLSIPAQTYIRLIETVEPIDDLSARAKEALAPWGRDHGPRLGRRGHL